MLTHALLAVALGSLAASPGPATAAPVSDPAPPPGAVAAEDPSGTTRTVPVSTGGMTDAQLAAYWTPQRQAAARPAGGTKGAEGVGAVPGAAYTDPATPTIPHAYAPVTAPPALVGRVYFSTPRGNNYCSASVVRSRTQSTVMTAAHCVGSSGSVGYGAVFIPGYYAGSGSSSLGVFPVRSVTMKTPFSGGSSVGAPDDRYDHAILTVGTSSVSGKTVQAATGGALFLASPQLTTRPVQAWGYNYGESSPRTCTVSAPIVWKYLSGVGSYPFRALGCNPFSSGVSGGPFFQTSGNQVPQGTHPPVLVGNVGGWVGGGWDDATSYSVVYRAAALNSYLRASGLAGWAASTPASMAGARAVASGNFTRAYPATRDVYTVWGDGSVTVQAGTGNPVQPFAMPIGLGGADTTRAQARSASVGDLNRNGIDDLIVTLAGGRTLLYLDVSTRGLSSVSTIFTPEGWWSGVSQVQAESLDGGPYRDDIVVQWELGAKRGLVNRYLNFRYSGTSLGATWAYAGDPRTASTRAMAFGELGTSGPVLLVRLADGRLTSYSAPGTYGLGRPTLISTAGGAGADARTMTVASLNYLSTRRDDVLTTYWTSGATICFDGTPSRVGSCYNRASQN